MYGRKDSLPEDTICRLLDSLAYDDIKEFKNSHKKLALVTRPDFGDFVHIDQTKIESCANDFRVQLDAAKQFLDNFLVDVAEQVKTAKAVQALHSTIDRAMTPDSPGVTRNQP